MSEYADYILRTGGGLEAWEDVFGSHLYGSRFTGRRRVLDIGPGRCWFIRQAPEVVEGLDPETALVEHYRGEGLRLTVGSVSDIPFPDADFDGVFCCWLFEHLHEPVRALAEIHRILEPGGYLCLIVPSARTLLTTFYDDYTHVRPFTAASLHQLADDVGFARAHVEPLFFTRAGNRVTQRFGPRVTLRMLKLMDRRGRAFGLVNRNHLVLEARK